MSKQKNKLVKNTIISIVSGALLIFITIQLYPLIFKSSYEEYEKKYSNSKGLPYEVYKFLYLDKKKQETKYIWEQIDFGQYYALIISNNKYRLLPNLANAVNDGAAIASILEKQYQFQINHIKNANEDKIYEAFEKLKTLSKNTNILIYYSGHGKLDEKTNTGYWLPIDAHEAKKSKWISDEDIKAELRSFNSKHILVIADSCFSGTILRRELPQVKVENLIKLSMLNELTKTTTRMALTSGDESPVVDKKGNNKHSVFAKELLDILKENEEIILASQLFKKIKSRLLLNEKQKPQFDYISNTGSHTGGDFIFVKRKNK